VIAAAAVSALALAGCGSTVIDNDKVQNTIKATLAKNGYSNISISCPSDVPAKQGRSFTCTATYTANGQSGTATIPVNQLDNKGTVYVNYHGSTTKGAGSASSASNSGSSGSTGNS
jgi:hypothetical protein